MPGIAVSSRSKAASVSALRASRKPSGATIPSSRATAAMIEAIDMPAKRIRTRSTSMGRPMRLSPPVSRPRLIGSLSMSTPSQSKMISAGRSTAPRGAPGSSDGLAAAPWSVASWISSFIAAPLCHGGAMRRNTDAPCTRPPSPLLPSGGRTGVDGDRNRR